MKKKILSFALSLVLLFSAVPFSAGAAALPFTDVKTGDWYYAAVTYASENKLVNGMSDTKFSPATDMTRGMFVTVLGRMAGVDKSRYNTSSFADVKSNDWYGPYVEWAYLNGIVTGINEEKFSPNGKITREQIATILYRFALATNNDTSVSDTLYDGFPDSGSVSSYAINSMKWATHHKIINGSSGKLIPRNNATRAHVVQMLFNSKDLFANVSIPNQKYPVIYYWVPGGKSYHVRENCQTLNRSKIILHGSLKEAFKSEKKDPCNVCIPKKDR